MADFPDVVPVNLRPIVIPDDSEFVYDREADFNLASSQLVDSDSDLENMVMDESILMNATLHEIHFDPDTE